MHLNHRSSNSALESKQSQIETVEFRFKTGSQRILCKLYEIGSHSAMANRKKVALTPDFRFHFKVHKDILRIILLPQHAKFLHFIAFFCPSLNKPFERFPSRFLGHSWWLQFLASARALSLTVLFSLRWAPRVRCSKANCAQNSLPTTNGNWQL